MWGNDQELGLYFALTHCTRHHLCIDGAYFTNTTFIVTRGRSLHVSQSKSNFSFSTCILFIFSSSGVLHTHTHMLLTFPCSVTCLKWTSPAAVHQKCRFRGSTNVAKACLPSSNTVNIQPTCLYTLITPLPVYLPLFSTSLPCFPPPRYVWSWPSWLLCSEMCGNSSLASTLPYVSAPLNTTNAHACCACGCAVLSSCLCALVWTHAHNYMSSTDLQLCLHIISRPCAL